MSKFCSVLVLLSVIALFFWSQGEAGFNLSGHIPCQLGVEQRSSDSSGLKYKQEIGLAGSSSQLHVHNVQSSVAYACLLQVTNSLPIEY